MPSLPTRRLGHIYTQRRSDHQDFTRLFPSVICSLLRDMLQSTPAAGPWQEYTLKSIRRGRSHGVWRGRLDTTQ